MESQPSALPPTPPTPANDFNAPTVVTPPPEVPAHHKHRKLMIIIAAITMFSISLIAWGTIYLFPTQPPASGIPVQNTAAATETEQAALNRLTKNAERKTDVSSLLSGMANYAANHQGNQPTTTIFGEGEKGLELCDSNCPDGSSEIVKFNYYLGSQIMFKAYESNLAAPDVDTVYIVPSATCRDANAIGQPGNNRQVAIMFDLATADSASPEERCQSN